MADADVNAINFLIDLYGFAIDTQCWDLFDRVFTRDVEIDYNAQHWNDLETFKRDFAADHEPFDETQHAMTSKMVQVDGNTARSFTYCSWRIVRKGTKGGDFLEGTGWYDDRLICSSGVWLIKHRINRILWWDGNLRVVLKNPSDEVWEPQVTSLRLEAAAGKIPFLSAICRK